MGGWRTESLVGGDRNQSGVVTLLGRGPAQTSWGAGDIPYLDAGVGCMCAYHVETHPEIHLRLELCMCVLQTYV